MEDDRRYRYGTILEETLREWGRWQPASDPLKIRVVIDRDTDTYLLTRTGWQADRHILSTVFHATLKEGKVYIEWDGTQPSLTVELLERSIPRTDIVFAWQPSGGETTGDGPPTDFTAGVWRIDVRRRYQTIIKEVLREYEGYEAGGQPYPLHSHFVVDDEHADYLMVTVGLQPRSHWPVHAIIFHAWIDHDIVWVACDNVSPSVSEELIARGIPRRDVRPAWEYPFDRTRPADTAVPPAVPFSTATATYRAMVQEALSRFTHTEAAAHVRPVALFDTRADRYAVLTRRLEDDGHAPRCLILVTLRDGQVWVDVDTTGDAVAARLVQMGIPDGVVRAGPQEGRV